jgi:demethylmenaquinone methyltransferase/2-methoxy-6-polyprenyl-1,4-benzoquinol methylase
MKKGVQNIFSEVSGTYELVNHVLTFGLDILWRKRASKEAAKARGSLWLDVCSGTGEFAHSLRTRARGEARVVIVDFCPSMVRLATEKRGQDKFLVTIADALQLPFPDETFDLVTISFATRNINLSRPVLTRNFQEFYRLLKPGGRFVNLETSQPGRKFIRKLFHGYVRTVVKPVGYLLSGSRAGYTYLSATIPRFYGPEELAGILAEAGFGQVTWKPLFFGMAAIHVALKKG